MFKDAKIVEEMIKLTENGYQVFDTCFEIPFQRN